MSATISSGPVADTRHATSSLPVVEREDIAFHSPRPGRLLVEVTFRNPGSGRTQATFGILRSAPLGAFVPWQDLGYLQVPALGPGESTVVATEFECESPEPLGSIDKVPPDRVLTALGSEEPRRRRRRGLRSANPAPAPDLLTMLSMGSVHWAGNLNVFFPGADVERHMARALRIYPGRKNMAAFIVGQVADRYQFHLAGKAIEWKSRLYDSCMGLPIAASTGTSALTEGKWHQPMSRLFALVIEPPPEAEAGAVNVHIRQKSSGREAVVEFTMDARAAGPGCYKI